MIPIIQIQRLAAVAGLLSLTWIALAAPPPLTEAPLQNFRLGLFDDITGRKTADLRGATARYHTPQQVEIRDFTLTMIEEGGATTLTVASPQALLSIDKRTAVGESQIRVEGNGFKLSGQRWRVDEPARTISIREQARVEFTASMIDILQ
jgi:hypothetical protein